MRNFLQHLKGVVGGAVAALMLIAMPVFAGPAGVPPGGNVDAGFNSVTAGGGAVDIGGSFGGKNYGVLGQGRNMAGGRFESLTTPTNIVELGLADAAMKAKGIVDVEGVIRNEGLEIGADGTISNSGVKNGGKVVLKDGNGVSVAGNVAGTPGGPGGLDVINSIPGGLAATFKGYYGIRSESNDPVGLAGHFKGGGGDVYLSSADEALSVNGKASFTGDLRVISGKIKASGGIGRIYTKTLATPDFPNVGPGAYSGLPMMSCDATAHRRFSCSFATDNSVVQADSVLTDSTCTLYVKNLNTTESRTVTPNITCFDPNGTW